MTTEGVPEERSESKVEVSTLAAWLQAILTDYVNVACREHCTFRCRDRSQHHPSREVAQKEAQKSIRREAVRKARTRQSNGS